MSSQTKYLFRSVFLCSFVALLAACSSGGGGEESSVGSDAQDNIPQELIPCGFDGESPEIIIATNSTVTEDSLDGYRLYLSDIVAGAQETELLNADDKRMRDDFLSKAFEAFGFDASNASLYRADNPLDYIENLLSSPKFLENDESVQQAKDKLLTYVHAQTVFCSYKFENIKLESSVGDDTYFAEIGLSYFPDLDLVQFSILVAKTADELRYSSTRTRAPFVGFSQTLGQEVRENGFRFEVLVRQAIVNALESEMSVAVDDGRDNKVGQIILSSRNTVCPDDACLVGAVVREPQKEECQGELVQVNTFNLGGHSGLKRARLEVDYASQQVKLYVSQFNKAVYDVDGSTPIYDPTNCEKQAIIDEMARLNPGEAAILELYEDPGFEVRYIFDEEGEKLKDENGDYMFVDPDSLLVYQGSYLPHRK